MFIFCNISEWSSLAFSANICTCPEMVSVEWKSTQFCHILNKYFSHNSVIPFFFIICCILKLFLSVMKILNVILQSLKQNESPPSSVVNKSSVLDVSHVTKGRQSEKKLRSCQQNEVLVSPVVNDLSILDMSNVTVGRGSERKLRNRKQNETSSSSVVNELSVLDISNATASVANESSVLDMSNVTVGRGSERKPRNRKVSFLSPVMTPRTPKNSNLKMRPKTPIVSRTPLDATISPYPMKDLKVNLGERVNTSLHLTPLPEKFPDESSISKFCFCLVIYFIQTHLNIHTYHLTIVDSKF